MADWSINPDNWLRLHGSWNKTKTVAKTNLFTVPISVLCDNRNVLLQSNDDEPDVNNDAVVKTVFSSEGRGLTCLACRTSFLDLTAQHFHFKSDFHRFNLKRNLKSLSPLSEPEYLAQLSCASAKSEDVDNENSDSNDEDEDDDDDANDLESTADETDANLTESLGENGGFHKSVNGLVVKQFTKGNGPVFVFSRDSALVEWEYSLSIAAFHPQSGMHSRFWNIQFDPWQQLYEQVQRVKNNVMSCVFLLRSGRFAAVVFEGEKIVIHKVLRRYTVRAKAGGGQSSHDNKGGKAKSAGAMLRRYGEQALKEDIGEILRLWSSHLQCCETIYVSAPKTMRGVFFDEAAGSPMRKDDPRVSYVPFLVDRPTLEEAKFVHARCTSIFFSKRDKGVRFSSDVNISTDSVGDQSVFVVSEVEEEEEENLLRGGDRQKKDRKQKIKSDTIERSVASALASVELAECRPSRELVAACASGDDTIAVKLLRVLRMQYGQRSAMPVDSDSEEEDDNLPLIDSLPVGAWDLSTILNSPDSLTDMSTPLHLASSKSMSKTVAMLLTMGADPTKVDVRGRPPYFLATDKDTRDAYRRHRATVGENAVNWVATGVAAPLTEDMERDKKNKEKDKKKRAALRKKEQKLQSDAAAKEAQLALERQKQQEVEMTARRYSDAGQCGACAMSLFGIKSLDVYDRRCCSAKCVIALRRTLAAAAAMKRFEK